MIPCVYQSIRSEWIHYPYNYPNDIGSASILTVYGIVFFFLFTQYPLRNIADDACASADNNECCMEIDFHRVHTAHKNKHTNTNIHIINRREHLGHDCSNTVRTYCRVCVFLCVHICSRTCDYVRARTVRQWTPFLVCDARLPITINFNSI